MESIPPLKPRTRRSPPRTSGARRALTRAESVGVRLLLRFDFLELAIADQLLEALLEQLIKWLLAQLPPALLKCFLQALHHRFMIAMRASERLVDDLVDQPERLEASRSDAERLGRFGRVLGAFPQN